ncbi:MAG: 2Fe-2S iron-sulfur cluster-binding protein [Clostridia bacterium]|nr:2Fe-2S iron-sulfur cluster-binding protein [Clostridia bacterium]
MLVRIKRQAGPNFDPIWQTFEIDCDPNTAIASVINKLNARDNLVDVDGNKASLIKWECGCSQKLCGACAMVINGKPALACSTYIKDFNTSEITIAPLSKFPVVEDLIVDRSIIQENLKEAKAYIDEYASTKPKDYAQLYSVSKCLKCGLCLEVCPNYNKGEHFFGAMFANESFDLIKQTANRKKELKKEFSKHFAKGCSKSLSCIEVCPMKIDTIASMTRAK